MDATAVRSEPSERGKRIAKSGENTMRQLAQAVVDKSVDDEDLDSESDSYEEASEGSNDEESKTSNAFSDDEMDVDGSEEEDTTSDDEEEDDDCDDDAEGEDWVDVEDVESDPGSSSSDEEGRNTNVNLKIHGNEGWADAMSKILRSEKPRGKKTVVLAKAKKLNQISNSEDNEGAKTDYGFEIDKQGEGEDSDVKPNVEELDVKPKLEDTARRLAEFRSKPSLLIREREKALSKIATKGVVQLFNAVRQQQKTIGGKLEKAKGSVVKEERVLKSIDKRAFLDVLMGAAPSERVENYVQSKTKEDEVKKEEPATWSVLRDNFLTDSNLKNWDKCSELKVEDDLNEIELN